MSVKWGTDKVQGKLRTESALSCHYWRRGEKEGTFAPEL